MIVVKKSTPQKVSGGTQPQRPSVFSRLSQLKGDVLEGRLKINREKGSLEKKVEGLSKQFEGHTIQLMRCQPGGRTANYGSSSNGRKLLIIDESPIPKGKRHVAEVSVNGGMASLRVIVRNEEGMKPQRMVKPSAKVEEGKKHLNKHARESKLVNAISHQLTHPNNEATKEKICVNNEDDSADVS